MSLVKIRLATTRYINHLEWEDGPGSLQNVVSDTRLHYDRLGTMTLEEAKALTKSHLEDDYGVYFEEDSGDGFEEYSFMLEYFDIETRNWRLVKVIYV